jgi:hypothetical protein
MTSACPGCGVVLPESDWPVGRRTNASGACWHLHGQILGYEAEHLPQLGRFHQLTVDTYGAQHGGEPSPPISLPFALIGLHLAMDEGWRGDQVRAAHQALARRPSRWPVFTRPAKPGWVTVADVAGAPTPEAHAERVRAWAASVWEAWRGEHSRVRAWADAELPPEARARLRSA